MISVPALSLPPSQPENSQEGRTCGTRGTTAERVIDCARPVEQGGFGHAAVKVYVPSENDDLSGFDDSRFYVWRLMMRSREKEQYWLDETAKVMWSDKSANFFTKQVDAQGYCYTDVTKSFGLSSVKTTKAARPSSMKHFLLPEIEFYQKALRHGWRTVVPSPHFNFWTNSLGGVQDKDDPYRHEYYALLGANQSFKFSFTADGATEVFGRCQMPVGDAI